MEAMLVPIWPCKYNTPSGQSGVGRRMMRQKAPNCYTGNWMEQPQSKTSPYCVISRRSSHLWCLKLECQQCMHQKLASECSCLLLSGFKKSITSPSVTEFTAAASLSGRAQNNWLSPTHGRRDLAKQSLKLTRELPQVKLEAGKGVIVEERGELREGKAVKASQ
jgi:hypothetical protein